MQIVIPAWFVLAVIAGMIGAAKGRSFVLFFLYGLLFWPIAIVHGILLPRAGRRKDGAFVADGALAGIPYKRDKRGRYLAAMGGEIVAFKSFEDFAQSVKGSSNLRERERAVADKMGLPAPPRRGFFRR